MKDFVF